MDKNVMDFKPWAGAALNDWENAADPLIITDMTKGNAIESLSDTLLYRTWKVIPYETLNGYRGNMVWAAPEADAPELSVELGISGWHAIFIGLFSAPEASTFAWIRLNTDCASVPRVNKNMDYFGNTEEVFFKVAKLAEGSKLHFSPQTTGMVSACGITHIKLIPLSETEVDMMMKDCSEFSSRTMTATYDGFSSIFYQSPRTHQEWLSQIEFMRGTDIGTLLLHSPGADKVIYPSKVGHLKGSHMRLMPRIGDRYFSEAIQEMERKGINPYKLLIDGAHEMGMKVHAGIRPAGWSIYEPFSDYWESPFYRNHLEWRCQDRNGDPVARMSFAVPEVRRHFIELLEEQITLGADGVHIAFNRGYPLILFEEASCELFHRKYGVDQRILDDSDARIIEWRSEIIILFMQEIRDMLDRLHESTHREKSFEISIMVLGNEKDNQQYGVDIRKLAEKRLMDEVFSYKWDFGGNAVIYDYSFFKDACKDRKIRCNFSTASYFDKNNYNKKLINQFIKNKVDGIAIWDADATDIFRWSVISRFGHIEESRWRMQNIDIENPPRTIWGFHQLGNQIRDGKYGPFWGG